MLKHLRGIYRVLIVSKKLRIIMYIILVLYMDPPSLCTIFKAIISILTLPMCNNLQQNQFILRNILGKNYDMKIRQYHRAFRTVNGMKKASIFCCKGPN